MQKLIQNNLRVFIILLIAGFVVYGNVIPGKFLFDDNLFIENNEQIKSISNITTLYRSSVTEGSSVAKDNFYRPNQQAVNALLYALFGLNPAPFHIASILFHILNSFLVFLLFTSLGIGRNASFFSALIFLIHPVNTQAVSYVSGMADPLGMVFILSALLFFIKAITSGPNRMIWSKEAFFSVLFFVLGLLTKENTVVFPALAVITCVFFQLGKKLNIKTGKNVFILLGMYMLIAAAYLFLKFTALNFAGNLGLTDQKNIYTEHLHIRLITFINILPEYFKMILFPVRLNYEKPYTAFVDFQRPGAILSLIFIFAITCGIIYSLVKKTGTATAATGRNISLLFAFCWFFICLAPMSGIVPVNAMYLEHWLYYPLIGIIFYGACAYESQKTFAKRVFLTFLIPLTFFYAGRTVLRNSEWASPEKFYKTELRYSPGSARIHNNLAMVYAGEKKCPQAIVHYKKAIALYDIYPQTHHNLARCYEATGNINEAVNEYFKALLLYPDFAHSHRYLSAIFQNNGDTVHAAIFANFLSRIQKGESIDKREIIALIGPGEK